MRKPSLPEHGDRVTQMTASGLDVGGHPGELTRAAQQPRALDVIVGECSRPFEASLRLGRRGKGSGALSGADEPGPRRGLDLIGVARALVGLEGVEEVRSDDLGDLGRIDSRVAGQELRSGEVALASFTSRQRFVRDALHECLEEAELPPLGRPRIGLEVEQLLA